MIDLLFIRHGATAGNLEKRYIGRTDEPLCEQGIAQIRALKGALPQPDHLFVSPLLRTRQSAQILFPHIEGMAVDAFRETDFGVFEGKNYLDLSGDPSYQAWLDSFCQGPIPGGECANHFKARCCQGFRQVMETVPDGSTAAFVIHGGAIMAILEEFVRPKQDFYHYHIGNGQYIQAYYRQGMIYNAEPQKALFI